METRSSTLLRKSHNGITDVLCGFSCIRVCTSCHRKVSILINYNDQIRQILMSVCRQQMSIFVLFVVKLDIVDTGRTLNDIVKLIKTRNPISLRVVTLLDKPSRRIVEYDPDLALFTIPDHFVIGYGLDCGEYFRNLPYIAEYTED